MERSILGEAHCQPWRQGEEEVEYSHSCIGVMDAAFNALFGKKFKVFCFRDGFVRLEKAQGAVPVGRRNASHVALAQFDWID